jgi:hypothetical protein
MARQNGTSAACKGDARREVCQLGGDKPHVSPHSHKNQSRRRTQRAPASIYHGRERLGRVEPLGDKYRAFNADDQVIGTFASFSDAVASTEQRGRR